MSYQEKYKKYKNKYLKLKQQIGGKQLTLYDLNDRSKNTKYFADFDEGDTLYQIEMQLRAQLTKNKIDFDDIKFYKFDRNMCLPSHEVNQIEQPTDLCFKTSKRQVFKPVKMVTGFYNGTRPLNDQEGMFYHIHGIFNGKIVRGFLDESGYAKITEGTGTLTKTTTTYHGDFLNNELILGKKIFSNGDIDEGEFTNGQLNGKGKKTYSAGSVYEGEFINGELKSGKITFEDDFTYEGEFINGQLNGKGKKTFKNGAEEGEFINGQLNGKGKKTFKDWTEEGNFINGQLKSGKKTYSNSILKEEEGLFLDNKLEGKGKKTYSDGFVDEGEFKNGQSINLTYTKEA
jgi:hypothetical protein